jgi:CubicO group peptidase (beta-lactamase class C family)
VIQSNYYPLRILLSLLAIVNYHTYANDSSKITELKTGVILTDTLQSEDTHFYQLKLSENQFVFGDAVQIGVDLEVSIFSPEGENVATFDGPSSGSETFQFSSTKAGNYQIRITPFEKANGKYSIQIIHTEQVATTPIGTIEQLMSIYNNNTPGAVIAIVQNGELDYVQGYGMANIEYDIPNTKSTPYHMASVSKQFTAFAIVMLANEGKLSLDKDIRNYLPELPVYEHEITVRHLLNHTSGLRDHWTLWAMSGGMMDDVIRQSDLLRLIKRQQELNFIPGDEFLYSNTGYLLLSEIVSSVTGIKFGDWMKTNVFKPLGMNSTQIYDDHERIVKNRAYSYKNTENGLAKSVLSYANSGATSLFTTAEDLAIWLGNFKTGKVGGLNSIKQLQEQGILNGGEKIKYALGIGVDTNNGLRRLSHGGADAGYRTNLSYYPEIDAGIIILSNSANFQGRLISQDISNAFFGEHMKPAPKEKDESEVDPSEQVVKELNKWDPDKDELSIYTGRYYSDELETFYTIFLDDNKLMIKHRRHGEFNLTAKQKDEFASREWYLGNLKFVRSPKGVIKYLYISNGRIRNLIFKKVNWK